MIMKEGKKGQNEKKIKQKKDVCIGAWMTHKKGKLVSRKKKIKYYDKEGERNEEKAKRKKTYVNMRRWES